MMLGKYDGGGPTSYITKAGDDRGAFGMEYEYLLKNNYRWNDSTMTMSPR